MALAEVLPAEARASKVSSQLTSTPFSVGTSFQACILTCSVCIVGQVLPVALSIAGDRSWRVSILLCGCMFVISLLLITEAKITNVCCIVISSGTMVSREQVRGHLRRLRPRDCLYVYAHARRPSLCLYEADMPTCFLPPRSLLPMCQLREAAARPRGGGAHSRSRTRGSRGSGPSTGTST